MSKAIDVNKDTEDDTKQLSEEEEEDQATNRQFNKFQLLQLVDQAEVDIDDEQDEDDAKNSGSESDPQVDKGTNKSSNTSGTNTKRKTRKRRMKNKTKKNNDIHDLEDEFLNNNNNQVARLRQDSIEDDYVRFKLLKVDMRNLQPEAELKRIFGKGVVREEKSKPKQHPGVNLQRSRFVSSGYYEPKSGSSSAGPKMALDDKLNVLGGQTTGGATIKNVDFNSNRPVYFKIFHDESYQEAHRLFLEAVHRGHPESIVQNTTIFPFHAESLIQLSHMVRISEDYKTASELIERALLVFERGFHPRFNITTATCRLSYRRPENRAFFIAIFKHITFCHRRGLRKTPLEYSKLLLSLEPETDPLLSSQLLDFFAIRSEEYDYLIEMVEKWQSFARLPNMKLSLALAHFLKSRNNKLSKAECDKSLNLANECLEKALLLFPNFIITLLEACSAEPDSELKKCNYFDYSVYGKNYKLVPETIDVLVNLYVKRNFVLWKPKHVLTWLEQNVAKMVSKFAQGELIDEGLHTNHWANFNKPVAKNLLRHIVLSDLGMKIPTSAASYSYLDIDPFPPTDPIISYKTDNGGRGQGQTSSSASLSGGISGLFLRSMLPSFSFGGESGASSSANNDRGRPNTGTPANVNQELSLGDFVPDEAFDEMYANGGLNELQGSIRDLVGSLSRFLSMVPIGQSGDNQQPGGESTENQSNTNANQNNNQSGERGDNDDQNNRNR